MESLNHIEDELLNQNKIIAGVDEVGRGSLMGPIVTVSNTHLTLPTIYSV